MVSVKAWTTHWNTMENSELDPWLKGSFVCDEVHHKPVEKELFLLGKF